MREEETVKYYSNVVSVYAWIMTITHNTFQKKNLRSLLEVRRQQLEGVCVHVRGTDGGPIPNSLRGVHIGAAGAAVVLPVHSLHDCRHSPVLDDAFAYEVVD